MLVLNEKMKNTQSNGGITFFTVEDNMIYVNRLKLETNIQTKVLLGTEKEYPDLAGCFSTDNYVGWHTDYGNHYFFYDLNTKKFEKIDRAKKKETSVFSNYCDEYLFYMNIHTDENEVLLYNFDTKQTFRYLLQGDYMGMFFRQYQDERIDLEVVNGSKKGIISFPID